MSILINEIKKICREEGISFSDFIEKINCPRWGAINQIGDLIGESDK
jgi:UDP-N-acetyl-D-mannosaminuronate dehydrogenase